MGLESVKTIDLLAELIMRRDPTGSIGDSVFFTFFPWKGALEGPVVITVEKNHHNKLLSHHSIDHNTTETTTRIPCVNHQHEAVLPTNPPTFRCVHCKNTYPLLHNDMHSVHEYEYEYEKPKVCREQGELPLFVVEVGGQTVHKDEFVKSDNRQDSPWDYWSPVVG